MLRWIYKLFRFSFFGLSAQFFVFQLSIGIAISFFIYAMVSDVNFHIPHLVPYSIKEYVSNLSLDYSRITNLMPYITQFLPSLPRLPQLSFGPDWTTLWIITNGIAYPHSRFGFSKTMLAIHRTRRYLPFLTTLFLKVITMTITWVLAIPFAIIGLFSLYFHHRGVEKQAIQKFIYDAKAMEAAQKMTMEGRRYR